MLARPVHMKKISLYMVDTDAQQAALTLARMQVLHPFNDRLQDMDMQEYPANAYSEQYNSLSNRFTKLTAGSQQNFTDHNDLNSIVTLQQIELLDEELKDLWAIVSALEERQRQQVEKLNATQQLIKSLQKFISLDLDLSRLKHPGRFLKIIVGSIPSGHLAQLKRALSLADFMIESFYSAEGIDHVVVVGSSLQQHDVQDLLKSADFREINVPEEFSGNPAQLQVDLTNQTREIEQAIETVIAKREQLLSEIAPILQNVHDVLLQARPYASLAMVLKGKGGLVFLQGWVPARAQDAITLRLQQDLRFPVHIQFSSPHMKEYESVPSLLEHNWLLRPFQSLVSNFGIPCYAEFDPTVLFSISYILMFGMMFGDVGHGAVIALASMFLWKRYRSIAIVASLAGISSIVFGFIYGSLFGFEEVVEPLWMSPMHDPEKILLVALGWGAIFLLISNLLAILNFLSMGLKSEALYSGKGFAGLLFYLAALYAGYQMMANNQTGYSELILLALPMAVIMWHLWRHTSADFFERTLVVLIESLEHLISSVSGTLSFLRVAAFSLNHIALAAAVFSIAAMMDTTGHWITVVLGNLFIIVLEGAIVAIQCLRLEYYEGFSRFFSGTGKAFEPLKLGDHR